MFEIQRPANIPETREPPLNPEDLPIVPKDTRVPMRGNLSGFDILETSTSFQGGPFRPRSGYFVMAWSFAASMIDILVVAALVCLFLFCTLLIQRVGLGPGLQLERSFLISTAGLIFCFLHGSYLVLLRVYLGNSFGEWACGLRLGQARQRFSSRYSLYVLRRFAVVVGSGVIVLPILSLLTGVDWAGRISGLPLISVTPVTRKKA